MTRNITVTFDDGTTHVYQNAPDDITPQAVEARATKEFGKKVTALDGGQAARATGIPGPRKDETKAAVTAAVTGGPEELLYRVGGAAAQQAQRLRDTAAGLVRGAGSIGATAIRPFETQAENVQRRADMDAALQTLLGAEPTSGEYAGGKLGGEIAGTLGVGPALAAGLRFAPSLAAAVRTGGLGGTGAGGVTGLPGYGLRVAGGATSGGAQGLMVNPSDAEFAALIGATIPGVGRPAAQATGALYDALGRPLFSPAVTAGNMLLRAMGGKGDEAVNALTATQGMRTTPGFQPTLTERLAERGAATPTMAALEQRVASATPETNRMAYEATQQRIGALQGQLGRIDAQIARQSGMLQPAAREQLDAMRSQLLQSIENETAAATVTRNALERQGQQVAATLPSTGQLAPGTTLAKRATEMGDELRRTTVQPAYKRAFDEAGPARIDVQPVIAEAERILGRPLTEFAPETAPDVARALRALMPATPTPRALAAQQGISVGDARVMLRSGEYAPSATAPLATLDALRRAINSDIMRASRGQGALDATTAGNLINLNRVIDQAIDSSATLSQQAKDLYRSALTTYRSQYAPAFKEGVTGRLLKPSTFGETRVMPEDAVGKFLSDETAAQQFVTTFGRDPQAAQAMSTGIQDLFRAKVVDPVTRMVKPDAAAKFLQDNARQLDLLQQSGVNVRQALQQVQADAQQIAVGLKNLTQAAPFAGKGSANEMIDYMLGNTSNMRSGLARLNADGRQALAQEVTDRANSLLRQGDPNAALKFLTDKKEVLQLAMGPQTYADLTKMASLAKETATLAASMPKSVEGRLPTMLQGYSAKDLTSLELVARDIKRMQEVEKMAAFGRQTAAPKPGMAATEEAAGAPVTPQKMALLSRVWTFARNVFTSMEGRINDKTAAELSTLLYRDPDRAIDLIREAQMRAATKTAPVSAGKRVMGAGAVLAPTNMLAPSPQNQNALAQ